MSDMLCGGGSITNSASISFTSSWSVGFGVYIVCKSFLVCMILANNFGTQPTKYLGYAAEQLGPGGSYSQSKGYTNIPYKIRRVVLAYLLMAILFIG